MRFVWPAQRYDRLTKGPAALATALTVVACVATAIPLVSLFRDATQASLTPNEAPREVVTFLQQQTRQAATAKRQPTVTRSVSRVAPMSPKIMPIEIDMGERSHGKAQSTPAADTASASRPEEATPAARAIGPVMAPAAFGKVIIPEAAKDSIAKRMAAYYLKLLRTFTLTPEQKDSAGREEARRAVASREAHRPLPIPLGGVSIPLHRKGNTVRDSIANADYLQRLARLDERARAKRDSIFRASLAAKRDTDGRGDSLRRLTPRPDPRR